MHRKKLTLPLQRFYRSNKFSLVAGLVTFRMRPDSRTPTEGYITPAEFPSTVSQVEFLDGTSLCDCASYESPVDKDSHCVPRFCTACCFPFFSTGRLYSVVHEQGQCEFLGLGIVGWLVCILFAGLIFVFGAGVLLPLFMIPGIVAKYNIKPLGFCEWLASCSKTIFCFPCFLVQLRNFVELQQHKVKQVEMQPAQQIYMV